MTMTHLRHRHPRHLRPNLHPPHQENRPAVVQRRRQQLLRSRAADLDAGLRGLRLDKLAANEQGHARRSGVV